MLARKLQYGAKMSFKELLKWLGQACALNVLKALFHNDAHYIISEKGYTYLQSKYISNVVQHKAKHKS